MRAAVQSHRQKISLAKAELEAGLGKEFSTKTLKRFLKNIAAATSELRRRPKGQPDADVYALRAECLAELERLSEQDRLDLFS